MRRRYLTIFALASLLLPAVANAVVAPPRPTTVVLQNGASVRGVLLATEDADFLLDDRGALWRREQDGWRREEASKRALAKAASRLHHPLRGATALVALRVAFADRGGRVPRDQHLSVLFGEASSLQHYYAWVSGGALAVSGGVFPEEGTWFQLHVPLATYGADLGPSNSDPTRHDHGKRTPEDLIAAAVRLADPTVDFSRFDWDGDGAVDHLLIIHAGDDQAASGRADDIWSRQVVLPFPLEADGVRIESAMIVAETSPLGTFCHEFAHDLGAPDLYGTSDVGPWGLMGAGCWNGNPPGSCPARLSAPLLWDMDGNPANGREGWLLPHFAKGNGSLDLQEGPAVLPVDDPGKILLAEWRKRAGYDAALPSEGVLVYMLDAQSGATELLVPDQRSSGSETAALHPGQKLLLLGGKELQVVAPGQIEVAGAAVATAFEQDRSSDDVGLQVFPNPFNTATLIHLPAGQVQRVRVFDVRGRLVVDLGVPLHGGSLRWNGCDAFGRAVPSGTYLITAQTPRGLLTRKVMLLR